VGRQQGGTCDLSLTLPFLPYIALRAAANLTAGGKDSESLDSKPRMSTRELGTSTAALCSCKGFSLPPTAKWGAVSPPLGPVQSPMVSENQGPHAGAPRSAMRSLVSHFLYEQC
jgi:hypothetical protein